MKAAGFQRRVATIGALLLGPLAGAIASGPAEAALWQLQPQFRLSADHDTNRGFTTQPISDQAWNVFGQLRLSQATERSSLTLTPAFEIQRFADPALPDAQRRSLDFAYAIAGPTSQLRLEGGRRQQSTLFSEIRRSGLVDLDSERLDDTAMLAWSRTASPRWTTTLQLGWSATEFSGPLTSRLSDYRYPSVVAQAAYGASERTRLVVAASVGELRVVGSPISSRDEALTLGVDRDISERVRWSLRLGANRTLVASRSTSGHSGRFELSTALRQGDLTVAASRAVTPGGFGVLVARSEGSIAYAHRFSQRTSASLVVSAIRNDDVGGIRSGERARFEAFDASLSRRLSESWLLTLQAGSARAAESTGAAVATGWRAGLSMVWEPRIRSVSR